MPLIQRLTSLLPMQTKASQVGKLLEPSYKTAWVGFGGTTWSSLSLEKLTREGFCRNVIAHRCIRIVAECTASIPFLLFKGDKPLTHHPLLDVLKTPNPLQSGISLMEAFYGHYQIAGNAYMEVVTSAEGRAGELYVLRPDRMSIKAGPNGWPSAYEYKVGNKKHSFPVDQKTGLSDILHLKTFNPEDDYVGLSPLEPAAMSIDIHNAAAAWNKALLDNAARPSGALVFEPSDGSPANLSDEQFRRLKNELEDNYQGAKNAGRPFLLEGGLKWHDFLEAVENNLFKEAPFKAGLENNQEVEAAAARVNATPTTGTEDVLDISIVNDFLEDVARPVAKAKIDLPGKRGKEKEEGEKAFSIGLNADGKVVVQSVMVLTDQGGTIDPIIHPDTIAVVHVHFRDLFQLPNGGDHSPVVLEGIPSYVISHDGREVWAVGRIDGVLKFRKVSGKKPGKWKPFPPKLPN